MMLGAEQMDFEIGCAVKSTAGRDKGKLLVVMETGQNDVFVCDGKERPLQRPKKKNPRHLEPTGLKLTPEQTATNRALKKALAGLLAGCNGKP
jgi:ribosomal protein L14E/L6E/L27E